MAGMVRAALPWEEALADALRHVPRPIPTDPRFTPRDAQGRSNVRRYDRAAMPSARPAATLILLYPGVDGRVWMPLTVRHPELRSHAGEISLPGGAVEPEDESAADAAVRETVEEIGLDPNGLLIHGSLDEVWIPVSNFELRPFVAGIPLRPSLSPHTEEVASIIHLPVDWLLQPEAITEEEIEVPGWTLRAAVYRYAGERIWGATARTLAMLATVLRLAGPLHP